MASGSSSVTEVDYGVAMKEEGIDDVKNALIFRVPKPLRDMNDHLYTPHLVSIGPFHHGREELKAMEYSKTEAVRRMQERIQRKFPRVSIKSIVEENIVRKDKEIREFYGEQIKYNEKDLAWMVTRDACFIFEFLVNYVSSSKRGVEFYDEELTSLSSKTDPVFYVVTQNPTRERIMEDILLFENQIPLFVLQHLLQMKDGSAHVSNQRLSYLMDLVQRLAFRHSAFPWYISASNEGSHLLEVFYHGMLGTNLESFSNRKALKLPHSPRNHMQIKGVDSMKAICGWLRKLCLRFYSSETSPGEPVDLHLLKLPSAGYLTRQGVKIRPVLEKHVRNPEMTSVPPAIGCIRFDEKTSTLYLPQVRVTLQSDSLMRSIIAMEVSKWKYHPRPMTQLALFMDELIDSPEDVTVLRNAEVISNFIGSNQELAQLVNSLTRRITPVVNHRVINDNKEIPCVGCRVIDDVRMDLHKYTRRKYKILWSEFISAYFSKPWLVAGSIAAGLLLLMTVAQVLCLFITCNP